MGNEPAHISWRRKRSGTAPAPSSTKRTGLSISPRQAGVGVAFSADLGPGLLVPWRHPTLTIVYADDQLALESARFVQAEGRADASVLWRTTDDRTLLSLGARSASVDGIPITDPVQQWWDLRDLGGGDRLEAADRLRRAIIDKTLTTVS